MERLLHLVLRYRLLVLLALAALVVAGTAQYRRLPTDAFPDVSPIMVPVFAEAHGMAPEEVERLVTFPIESAMNGLPDVTQVKSTSAFGMAVVYVYFEDGVDIYFARQLVQERLASALPEMPALDEPPVLGPISTGLGEVFMYYLRADEGLDTGGKPVDTYLRELNDWVVKFQIQAVRGVTSILSMGGNVLQYQVRVDPAALHEHGVGLSEVVDAVTANNANAGGQFLVLGSEEYLVRGVGLLETLEQLGDIQVKTVDGTPVRVRDVAEVSYGNAIRRGVVSLNGESEVVAGLVLKLFGENTSSVIARLREAFPKVQAALPEGVTLVPYYDQGRLVSNATGTVKKALLQGAVLVALVLLLFLGNLRAAFIVALALPVCVLVAVLCMGASGLSANLMSLGGIAIAIGMLGDASIVVVENIHRRLAEGGQRGTALVVEATSEVARPILFSVAIIVLVFLPLFSLEGVEGKLFSPMAFTITFALLGSLVAALLFAPVLASLLLRGGVSRGDVAAAVARRLYRPLLARALRIRGPLLGATLALFIVALFLLSRLGTEFMPVLEEGTIQVNVTMAPSIALEEATATIMRMERDILAHFPEVAQTVAKVGRPEAGSHPHPVNFANIQLALKPESEWRDHDSKAAIVAGLNERLSRYPGVQLNFTQPIQNLFDELLSGARTQLAIKLYGDDLSVLRTTAETIREAIADVPGLVDLATEQSFGQPQVQVVADREACARYNVNVADILELVELAVGGEDVSQVYLNTRRFAINVRYAEASRDDVQALENLLVENESGYLLPLSQVARIEKTVGPIQVNRESNQRRWTIEANVRGRDLGGVVSDIQARVRDNVTLPPGYYVAYGGQFENQQRAMRRLAVIVPTAFALIFLMLYLGLGAVRHALLIFTNVPFALIGGVLGLFLAREYLSVPASVGFIALFGIAVQNGLVLVTCINQLREEGYDLRDAVLEGAVRRLRPVLMTALTTVLGLVPLLLATGMGSQVQRPLAVVVVCGLLSSTFLNLFLLPALYPWVCGTAAPRPTEAASGPKA